MKTMPFCSAFASARVLSSSSLTMRAGFLVGERLERFADAQLAGLGAPAAHALEHLLELLGHLLHAGRAHDLEAERHGAQLDLDLALVEPALAQHLAELLARLVVAVLVTPVRGARQQRVEDALLGRVGGARAHFRHLLLARLLHRDVHQLLDDRVHLAADVADLGELGGLDLDEGRARELREAARDLGLADAGRADHEDVLRRDLLAQRLAHLHAPPAVAERDRDRALGRGLADDVLVQLLDDLAGRHRIHRQPASSSMTRFRLV